MQLTNILKRPIITEKTLTLASEQNTYAFAVDREANKNQIKKAVEDQFRVGVIDVKIITIPRKTKRRGVTRFKTSVTPGRKKALVKLKQQDKIELFEVGG